VSGAQREFEQAALPHAAGLLRFARRLTRDESTAEEAVQEALLRAWRNFHQFARGSNARAWLFRILLNVIREGARRAARRPMTEPLTADAASVTGISERVELLQALEQIPEEQREVLMLAAVEGFKCREIAEILDVPMGTVMSRLARARQAMRERLTMTASVKAGGKEAR
jgi:RNA polymerase sigma-70 factor (ECF subfamily)